MTDFAARGESRARVARALISSIALRLTGAGLLMVSPCVLAAQTPPVPPTTRTTQRTTDSTARADSVARARSAVTVTTVTVVAERARAVPPPVARIDVDTAVLHRTPAANAYDLVRRVTGIEVHEQGQGPGFTSNAVIRGFNSDHSADVLLVIDGVPINAPIHGHVEGFADWNVLLSPTVSSMRVIHGTASPLYGDFSLAGVVEVFTAADANGSSAAVSTSSFGDAALWARTGTRGARSGSFGAVEVKRNQGWQERSDYWLGNGVVRGWRAVGRGRLEGGAQLYRSYWNSPGFTSIARFNTRDLRRVVDSTDGGESSRVIASARYAHPLGQLLHRPLAFEATAWAQQGSQTMYLNVPGQGLVMRQSGERDQRFGFGGQLQFVWQIPLGEVVLGTAARTDRATYTLDNTLARQVSSVEHSYDARFWSSGSFVRVRRLIANRLALDVGGRFDVVHHEAVDRLASTGWNEGTTTVASPKFGATYLTPWSPRGASVSLLASSSYGFRSPPGVIADPRRAPFLAWSHEAGVDIARDDFSVHAALFRIDTQNERVFDPITLGVSSAGQSRRQGLDTRVEWQVPFTAARRLGTDTLVVFGAVTLNDARFVGTVTTDSATLARPPQTGAFHDHNIPILPGDPVPGVARYTGRMGAELTLRRLVGSSIRASYRLLGPFTPIGEPGVLTRAASVLDLGTSIPIRTGSASLDVDVQNVIGLRYVENRASGFVTPGVPRVIRAGIRIR